MGDELLDGQMIEIGDPAEEPTASESPPRVVIEYRDRGVPWMLIPPMLVLSAVAAVLAYPRLAPPARPAIRPPMARATVEAPGPTPPPTSALPAPVVPAPVVAAPEPVAPPSTPEVAAPAIEPLPIPPAVATRPEPAPFPRVQGLGFDPDALRDRPGPKAPVDAEVAAAGGPDVPRRDEPPREPGKAQGPDVADQPAEVDPDVLPPDPREARVRRLKRVAEARDRAEAERGQFHADLRATCRRLGLKAGPEITALMKKYGTEVDPTIMKQAERVLNVTAAGADRPVRINILRSLGFPEPVILQDIFDDRGKWENQHTRDGARSGDEVMYRCALILLSYPPNRAASASRPVSSARSAPAPAPSR